MRLRKRALVRRSRGRRRRHRRGTKREPVKKLSPYQRMCEAKAVAQEIQNKITSAAYLPREEVQAERLETAQIISSDLGSFGKRLSGLLSGRVFAPEEVRAIADQEMVAVVARWVAAGKLDPKAVPSS